jgi:hypothetical protein
MAGIEVLVHLGKSCEDNMLILILQLFTGLAASTIPYPSTQEVRLKPPSIRTNSGERWKLSTPCPKLTVR